MNDFSLQTEPFNDGTVDGRYWQVVRRNDMSAFDNLPSRIRSYLQENFAHLPAEDILYDFRYTYKGDEEACLSALISDCALLSKVDQEQMAA